MWLRPAQQTNEMAADVRDAELKQIMLETVARYEELAQRAIVSAEPAKLSHLT
jgi:hypothetical protein